MKINSFLAGIPPCAVVLGYRPPLIISRKRKRHFKRQWIRAALLHVWQEYLWYMPDLSIDLRDCRVGSAVVIRRVRKVW